MKPFGVFYNQEEEKATAANPYPTSEMICLITESLSFIFSGDGTKPGLTIAYLPNTQDFYVSIVRYNPTKKVVTNTKGRSLERCLDRISHWILGYQKESPIDQLDRLVKTIENKKYNQ